MSPFELTDVALDSRLRTDLPAHVPWSSCPQTLLKLTVFPRHNDCYVPWANEGTARFARDVS